MQDNKKSINSKSNGKHSFKWMKYKNEKIRIDKDIAPLIQTMWDLGIHTSNCCQGVCSKNCSHKTKHATLKDGGILSEKIKTSECGNRIWIVFSSAKDMEKFYNLVAVYEKNNNGMYDLINGWAGRNISKSGKFIRYQPSKDNWEVIHYMPNLGVNLHLKRVKNNATKNPKYYYILDEEKCKKNKFVLRPQITFPRKHLDYVIERLNKAIEDKRENN